MRPRGSGRDRPRRPQFQPTRPEGGSSGYSPRQPPEASRGECSAWGALRVELGPPPEPAWGRGLPRRVWASADTRGACCRARGRVWTERSRVRRLGARRERAKRWPSLVLPGRWLSAASKQVGGHSARSKARPGREQQKLGRP